MFNALVETGDDPARYGAYFDGISVCLSKGLGTPVGSVLVGSRELIAKGRRIRKVFGGGWRQAGFLAAAGIYALDHHVQRLKEDHRRAQTLAHLLREMPFVTGVLPVETNIVIFSLPSAEMTKTVLDHWRSEHILAAAFGKDSIRLVTHLQFDDAQLERFGEVLKKMPLTQTAGSK